MSTQNNRFNQAEKDKMKIAVTGAIILTALIVGIGIFGYFYGRQKVDTVNVSPIPVIDGSKLSGQQILGTTTYHWQGTITATDNSSIIVNASTKDAAGKVLSKKVTAVIQPTTQILKWDLTAPPQPNQPTSQRTLASLKDLRPGQQIIVQSSSDITDNNEVAADTVTVLFTPQAK